MTGLLGIEIEGITLNIAPPVQPTPRLTSLLQLVHPNNCFRQCECLIIYILLYSNIINHY